MPRVAGVDGRALILDAASRLFYEHGTDAISVEQVASAAGVSKRALYYHFPSKDALVHAWLQAAEGPALAMLQAAASAAGARGVHPVSAILDMLLKWMKTPRFHGCAFINASRQRPDDPTVQALAVDTKAQSLRWFQDIATAESAPDPALRARQYLMLVDGLLATGHLYPPDQLVDTARSMLAAILQEPPKETRR